jgi:hypothetical protein
MVFNYNECALWALALYVEGGLTFDKINEAYARPPWTTEQILHPEKYAARERVTDMPPVDLTDSLDGDWERVESAIFGEFDLYNYIATVLDNEDVGRVAASGWGAGWLNLYRPESSDDATEAERAVVHVSLEFDNPFEFGEFLGIYNGVIDLLGGASVTRAPEGNTACWNGALEHAFVGWNDRRGQIDILMATDDATLKQAVSSSLATGVVGSCPGW